jgi:hypothetical protein
MRVTQTEFRKSLLDPERPTPEGLMNPDGTPANRRFDIYRNNVTASLTEAMARAFPVIEKLVGEEFFKAMAVVYLRAFPPESPLMMFYGKDFPKFLKGFPPVKKLGYLPDVARIELGLRHAYHGEDTTPADPAALTSVAPDALMSLRLTLAPWITVLSSPYPVHAIWLANTDENAPQPQSGAQDVLVSRRDYDPVALLLPQGGASFVETLQAGESFGAALGKATAQHPNFDLTSTLGALLRGQAITMIEDPS